ncbi:sugar phosphate isomerase/epimerase family protein [Trujillonella humicola]|uniref:sugar phosphate isomerase/epimerase family protein n=1 Tax=Trujillonella humicola TaxID=3383699 RepID=UPI0039064850
MDGTAALDDIGWVLWSGTVGLESPIPPRLEAARAGGYTRLSVSTLDVARAAEAGTPPAELGRRIRDAGLEVVLDPVMNWYDGPPRSSRFARFGVEEALTMAEQLQAVTITFVGQASSHLTPEEIAGPFGAACDRIAGFGAQAHLEFIPMTAIPDLSTAWSVVRAADRPNGGLLFDTWHFYRGDPDFDVLAEVPGERVLAVQIDDAAAEVHGTLDQDTQNRLLPGDGALDLERAVRELDRIGALRWVGPEVISPATAAMPAVEAARVAGDRVRELIGRVRSGARA